MPEEALSYRRLTIKLAEVRILCGLLFLDLRIDFLGRKWYAKFDLNSAIIHT